MPGDDLNELEIMLTRFRRLFAELMRGEISRNVFVAWELEILVDFQECELPGKRRMEILRQWERAVTRQMQCGPGPPMRLSEFLRLRKGRREKAKPSEPSGPRFDSCRSTLPL